MESTPIQDFYKNSNVFITGGTGFLGKLLIEKLLRSTEVANVYLLIREKKGKNKNQRLDELLNGIVFSRLRNEKPEFKLRVKAVTGDCSMNELGLSLTDRQTLISKVNIIFHVAATVRFTEKLEIAYNINVNGTKHVLNLAMEMTCLKSIVHVSTAFANCPFENIGEEIYDCPISCEELKKTSLMDKWPNTYTLTKAQAESLIKKIGRGMPLAIFRPSIIISTYKEPFEGWMDNFYGPIGVYFSVMSGLLRVLFCDENQVTDLVPADTCAAAIIATAWDVSKKESEDPLVYNFVSGTENRIMCREFLSICNTNVKIYPSIASVWSPFLITTTKSTIFSFLSLFLHTIPAVIIDFGALITGHKPSCIRTSRKIHTFVNSISYFLLRNWEFSNENTKKLWGKLSVRDKELFPMSVTTIQWMPCLESFIKGIRTYLLKDPDSTLEAARKRDIRKKQETKLRYAEIRRDSELRQEDKQTQDALSLGT